jgi:hypothetical protein
LLDTVACASSRRLDAGLGASERHDFAVRTSAIRQRRRRVHRIPPRVDDVAQRPSEGRDRIAIGLILPELLERALFPALPRRDTKPLAKTLLKTFGSFAEVIHAPIARLREVDGIGNAAITQLKLIAAAASRIAKGQLQQRTLLSSWNDVIDYCRTSMAFADKEQFRMLHP